MRVKLLRTLGRNLLDLVPPLPDDGDVAVVLTKDVPWTEGQVRDTDSKTANYLIRAGLAEESDDDLTPLPKQGAAAAAKSTAAYDAMTAEELHAEATRRNLEGRSALTTKADLIKALEKDDKAKKK